MASNEQLVSIRTRCVLLLAAPGCSWLLLGARGETGQRDEEEGGGGGWKSANEKENPQTAVLGMKQMGS